MQEYKLSVDIYKSFKHENLQQSVIIYAERHK